MTNRGERATSTVSVCIPTFNRPQQLEEAVASCMAQTFKDFEIIIGDDSDNDLTEKLIKTFASEIKIAYCRNRPACGQAGNINKLFDRSASKYTVLLHDDDLLTPDSLELLTEAAMAHDGCVAVFGKQHLMSNEGIICSEQSAVVNKKYFRTQTEGNQVQDGLWSALVQQFPNDCFLVKTEAAQITRYRSSEDVGDACDADFGFRLAELGDFFFVDEYTAFYRMSDSSVSSRGLRVLVAKTFGLVERLKLPERLNETRAQRLTDIAQTATSGYLIAGEKRNAARIFFSEYYTKRRWISKRAIGQLILFLAPPGLTRLRRRR